jgi:hypothetical protein
MTREQKRIRTLFKKLNHQKLKRFPDEGGSVEAPNVQGIYLIYAPRKNDKRRVVHVGSTYRGKAGLHQRLNDHLHNGSSFSNVYLKGHGDRLRKGYAFRCLPLASPRRRALLEAYAAGYLCPAHIGLNVAKKSH